MSQLTDLRQYNALQLANKGYWFDVDGILHGDKITWKPLPENATQPVIIPRSIILHTNGGSKPSTWENLWTYCNQPGITLDPHFDVDNSGRAGQFMSVLRRGDCSFDANSWTWNGKLYGAISIETGDQGAATVNTTPWNLDQLDTLIAIGTASAVQFDTGCNEVLAWDGKGIDYHTKFPYQGKGVKAWTNVYGKSCPGKARKLQLPYIRQEVANRVANYINLCAGFGIPHGIAGL